MTVQRRIYYDGRYETLVSVQKLGSYSAAGKVLGLTPSAVAQQVHSIEEELDVKLFLRKSNALCPTKECNLIVESVNQVQHLFNRLDDRLAVSHQLEEHISIGVTPSIGNAALAGILMRDQEEKAQVTVEILPAEELCDLLRSGALDLIVLDGEFPRNEFHSILLDTDRLVVAVSPDSTFAKKGYITLTELQKEKLILRLPDSNTRKLFEANLIRNGKTISDFSVMMEAENVDTIKKLVSAGYGVSVLSEMACQTDRDSGRIATVRLQDMEMSRSIHILYRPDCCYDEILKKIQDGYHRISL